MQFRKGHDELSVMEAVDNLSHMAELAPPEGESRSQELTEEQVSEHMQTLSWHDPEYFVYNRERVKETFNAIYKYMKSLYEKDKGQLRSMDTQKALQAIMMLAAEAVQKLDTYSQLFKSESGSAANLKEYQDLQKFYKTRVLERFQTKEMEEGWKEEWENGGDDELLDVQRRGLKDLETVRRDQEYELFFLRKEDGRPFFSRDLLRHLRMVGQFDELISEVTGEDPFLRIKIMQDKDLHTTAKEILRAAAPHIDDYYKESMRFKDIACVAGFNKALMALMLTANSRNMMQNTAGKSAVSYFADFQRYLRAALSSQEYRKFLSNPPDTKDRFFHTMIHLSQVLCSALFMRVGTRKEMVAFIHSLIERGGKGSTTSSETESPTEVWNNLLDEDEHIRYLLKQFPNGPLMKTLDMFREDAQLSGFDPLMQDNLPGQLFTVVGDEMHLSCLRLPSPVFEKYISRAEVVDEFSGFLRALGSSRKNQRHLLINAQDRTAWQEHARCLALEEVQKRAEFSNALMVVTLPKNTDFYHQSSTYLHLNDAKAFLEQFKEQIVSADQCGFFFPAGIDVQEIISFSEKAMSMIHQTFFESKEVLSRKNRLDFIELFYLLLTLKIIEIYRPDSISFTCKDAVDIGAAMSAELFAFMKILNQGTWGKEEKDFLLWMLYSGSLTIRERAIDIQRLNRMISALSLLTGEKEAHREQITQQFKKLYKLNFFDHLQVKEAI